MCESLKKGEKNYYKNLDVNKVIDNKTFWKTMKPFFSEEIRRCKETAANNITWRVIKKKNVMYLFNSESD